MAKSTGRKASKSKSNKNNKIESREVTKSTFPVTLVILGVTIVIIAAIVIMALTIKPASEGKVIEQEEQVVEQERVVETEAKEILSFLNKKDAYNGWEYSKTEPYLISAKGVADGARMSMCTGVDECKVDWWGTPTNAAKYLVTLTRFIEIQGAEAYFSSLTRSGIRLKEDCYVFNDYTALCRKYNFVFTIEPEYGSNFDDDLMDPLEDLTLEIHKEIDYWQ